MTEFLQIGVDAGAVVIQLDAPGGGQREAVGQSPGLGDHGDHILPEAVHALVQPETHDLLDLLPNGGVAEVQIGLVGREQVQVIGPPLLVPAPGVPLEEALPVVGQGIFPLSGRTPVVVALIGFQPPAAGLKPGVLVAGVVDDQIHYDLHPPPVQLLHQLLKQLHPPELPGDVHIIRHIVAVVRVGRGIERRKPDAVHVQGLDVVQLLQHPLQIADPVAVAVLEAPGPDLIKAHILIPSCTLRHGSFPLSGRAGQNLHNIKPIYIILFT